MSQIPKQSRVNSRLTRKNSSRLKLLRPNSTPSLRADLVGRVEQRASVTVESLQLSFDHLSGYVGSKMRAVAQELIAGAGESAIVDDNLYQSEVELFQSLCRFVDYQSLWSRWSSLCRSLLCSRQLDSAVEPQRVLIMAETGILAGQLLERYLLLDGEELEFSTSFARPAVIACDLVYRGYTTTSLLTFSEPNAQSPIGVHALCSSEHLQSSVRPLRGSGCLDLWFKAAMSKFQKAVLLSNRYDLSLRRPEGDGAVACSAGKALYVPVLAQAWVDALS